MSRAFLRPGGDEPGPSRAFLRPRGDEPGSPRVFKRPGGDEGPPRTFRRPGGDEPRTFKRPEGDEPELSRFLRPGDDEPEWSEQPDDEGLHKQFSWAPALALINISIAEFAFAKPVAKKDHKFFQLMHMESEADKQDKPPRETAKQRMLAQVRPAARDLEGALVSP